MPAQRCTVTIIPSTPTPLIPDFIVFDGTTSRQRQRNGQVIRHPKESGEDALAAVPTAARPPAAPAAAVRALFRALVRLCDDDGDDHDNYDEQDEQGEHDKNDDHDEHAERDVHHDTVDEYVTRTAFPRVGGSAQS